MARVRVPRTPLALAGATDQVIAAFGTPAGLAASGLTPAQLTELSDLAADVRAKETARDAAEGAFRAAVAAADASHAALEARYRAARSQAINHSNMTDELLQEAGIGATDAPLPGELPTVTDLSAVRRAAAVVFVDWTGPSGSALRYEVFARESAEAPWDLVGSATATEFTHEGADTSLHRQYQVVARRGERHGDPSNIAAIDP